MMVNCVAELLNKHIMFIVPFMRMKLMKSARKQTAHHQARERPLVHPPHAGRNLRVCSSSPRNTLCELYNFDITFYVCEYICSRGHFPRTGLVVQDSGN